MIFAPPPHQISITFLRVVGSVIIFLVGMFAVAICCEPLEPFRALLRHQRDSLTDPPIITCSQHSATPPKLPGRAATRRKPIKSPRHRRDHENLHLGHFSAFLRKTTTLWITHSQEESEGRLTIKDSGNEVFRTMPSK